jgi:hypothetical protein
MDDFFPVENDFELSQLLLYFQMPNGFPVLKGTGVNPCGDYLESVEDDKPIYVSIQPSTLFREICPQQCKDATPAANPSSNTTGDQDSASFCMLSRKHCSALKVF